MTTALWSIVLAAGHGRRLSDVTGGVPKQFYAPRGGRTLLEETVHRMAPVAAPARTVTVIDRTHEAYAEALRRRAILGRVIRQPMDRGTAVGVLLGLSELGAHLDDLVALTPSDHGIRDPVAFRRGVRQAATGIVAGHAEVVMLAVRPTAPAGDYGWILPLPEASPGPGGLRAVGAFVEKPDASRARRLFEVGAAWNTMVLVGRVGALLALYRQHLPDLATVFESARRLPPAARHAFLDELYPHLPFTDFSHDLLTPASGLRLYIWPDSLGWTDLGTPRRLEAWLTEQARAPEASSVRALETAAGGLVPAA